MHFEALSKVFFSLGVFALGLFSRRHDQSISSESKMWESFHLLVLQTKLKLNFTGNKNLKYNFSKLHFEYVVTNYLVIQILYRCLTVGRPNFPTSKEGFAWIIRNKLSRASKDVENSAKS